MTIWIFADAGAAIRKEAARMSRSFAHEALNVIVLYLLRPNSICCPIY
jgi:hypothetical protein